MKIIVFTIFQMFTRCVHWWLNEGNKERIKLGSGLWSGSQVQHKIQVSFAFTKWTVLNLFETLSAKGPAANI